MNTTNCATYRDIGFHDEAAPVLSLDEKLSVAAALALSLGFSGGLAWLAVDALVYLQA